MFYNQLTVADLAAELGVFLWLTPMDMKSDPIVVFEIMDADQLACKAIKTYNDPVLTIH